MKYSRKTTTIEAVQYTKHGDLVTGMCDTRTCLLDGNLNPHVHTIHDDQIVELEIGDWIIPEPDGDHYYPVKAKIFDETYEPVDNDNESAHEQSDNTIDQKEKKHPTACITRDRDSDGNIYTYIWHPMDGEWVHIIQKHDKIGALVAVWTDGREEWMPASHNHEHDRSETKNVPGGAAQEVAAPMRTGPDSGKGSWWSATKGTEGTKRVLPGEGT